MKALIILVFFPLIVSAHLDAEERKISDNYIIDFGWSPENPTKYESTTMSFFIIESTDENDPDIENKLINPDKTWIRISDDKNIYFSGFIRPEAQVSSITYQFPKGGTYEITTRFIKDDNILTQTSFQVKVGGMCWLYYLLIIPVAIIIAAIMYRKKWTKK